MARRCSEGDGGAPVAGGSPFRFPSHAAMRSSSLGIGRSGARDPAGEGLRRRQRCTAPRSVPCASPSSSSAARSPRPTRCSPARHCSTAGHTEVPEAERRPARDQHLLHHERGGGEVAPVGPALAAAAPTRGLCGRLRGEPQPAPVRRDRPRGQARSSAIAEDVAVRIAERLGRVRRPRARRPRGAAQRRSARDPHARVRQGPGRLRLPLRLLHHPHRPRRRSLAAGERDPRRGRQRVEHGQPEMVMTGISVGDYRDPERGLELGELMMEAARVPGRRAGAALERRGDPRQGLAARGAGRRAEGVPAPARPDAVGRRRRARAMGRHYTAEEYLEHIAALRRGGRRRSTSRPT